MTQQRTMKNIHILPTDKPSRLWTNNLRRRLELDEFPEQHPTNIAKHIYITNDEETRRGDYFISLNGDETYLDVILNNEVDVFYEYADVDWIENCKKIILTTDQDLIKDGVQAIDDEFLEWFVKNPGCEEVMVGYGGIRLTETNIEGYWVSIPVNQFELQQAEPKHECTCENPTDNTCDYCEKENKIEILEEAKKRALEEETLEEAAEIYEETDFITTTPTTENAQQMIQRAFIGGAKWQAERMYTEEDLRQAMITVMVSDSIKNSKDIAEYIQQLKKQ